jgi:predicted dehydrogenase
MDMGVYPLHALTGLIGPVRRVMAMTSRTSDGFTLDEGPASGKYVPMEVDDNWQLILDLGGARLGSLDANNCVRGTRAPMLEMFGREGTIALNLLDVSAPVELQRAGKGWETIEIPQTGRKEGPDHLLGVEHLVDCIERDEAPVLSGEHALHVVDVIESAARSSAEGCAVTITNTFQMTHGGANTHG